MAQGSCRAGGGMSSSGGRARAEAVILKAQKRRQQGIMLGKVSRHRGNWHSVSSSKWLSAAQ